jgi:periplasmic nitrate reductase NapD
MPISGVVVICAPGQSGSVAGEISSLAGVEVHGVLPDGQIVAVIEADSVDAEVALVSSMHDIEGVAAVQLAYHNFEDLWG